jgi:hypothetical protein
VGVALVLLFALEVTFVAIVATGCSSLLSPSNPRRSDFYVSIDRLVYLLVEVQSDKDQSDRYRMLLQAACAA